MGLNPIFDRAGTPVAGWSGWITIFLVDKMRGIALNAGQYGTLTFWRIVLTGGVTVSNERPYQRTAIDPSAIRAGTCNPKERAFLGNGY